ncbi:hypothetical protein E3N88_31273 [Mikania micrantha]|uniref:Uncharacterized protein n=1 Tax=Mikania micrantha TaxID=192012 RepID=A0A5N6MPV2_9ASTR|nr:hypothetical protein E3N88_31273 [Mikania micrantha]
MRPPVNEAEDEDYIKPPPPVSCKTSGRRNRGLRQGKRVAPDKCTRQLCFKSNGNISESKSENPVQKGLPTESLVSCDPDVTVPASRVNSSLQRWRAKMRTSNPRWSVPDPKQARASFVGFASGSPKTPKISSWPVSEASILNSFSDEKLVSLKKLSMISNDDKASHDFKSNSGAYMMVSSLIFTMFFGKLFGIVGTLILVCSLYPHRKNHHGTENMVAFNWPEKGSPEECKKRVIMAGLLERKNHYR